MQSPRTPFRELSPIRQDAARYCADNRPKLRRREDVPDNRYLPALWDTLPEIRPGLKEFPPQKAHERACRMLQRHPFPPFRLGTPQDIRHQLSKTTSSQATLDVLDDLYHHSGYDNQRKARTCRTRNKVIAKRLRLNKYTVREAIERLLKGHWIERPQKGVPNPQHPSGYQSLYVLPFNYRHILAWRTQPDKRPKK